MSNFNGPYLRVLTPRTVDGVNLKYTRDMKPIYKETHLPLSARKELEKENLIRPNQVKHIIEEVGTGQDYDPRQLQQNQGGLPNNYVIK